MIKKIIFFYYIRRLDGNQLICDCSSMFWLWDYVNEMRINRTFEMSGTCHYPAHLENKLIMNLQLKHFNCGKYEQ